MSILPDHAAFLVRAAPGLADEAGGVRIVHEDQRIIGFGQLDDLIQLGRIPVHRIHAVVDDHPQALVLELLQLLLQMIHVAVFVGVVFGAAQAHAVNDGGMHQAVGDHDVVLGQDRLEHAGIGIHAGGEEDRVLGAQEFGHDLSPAPCGYPVCRR